MAAQAERDDPLLNFRDTIARGSSPILSTSENPADTADSLSRATHITFGSAPAQRTFELTRPTRFAPDGQAIDLRSIYFAWLNKDAPFTEYSAAVGQCNEDLPSGAGGSVRQLSYAQRIEVNAWLSSEVETSESITPLKGAGLGLDAAKSAAIAGGKAGGVALDHGGAGQDMLDERLSVIYDGERSTGDRMTVLRGTKPMDFSFVQKHAAWFKARSGPDKNPTKEASSSVPAPLVANLQKRKTVQPIILLSPSASSLLRMSNVKSFLDQGVFVPPNNESAASNLLQLTRHLPSISSQPVRFILVDSTQNFKPPYWARVVAVFTTGQPWQFKSYKYPQPADLFSHYPGVFVGWQGEEVPENIKAWGRGVLSVSVDKWTGSSEGRWRDREIVETIWSRIEDHMRREGWTQYGPGTAGTAGR